MVKKNSTACQERLENLLQAVEVAQKLQNDIIRYGLEAAHFYVEDVDGNWLERWNEDEEEHCTSVTYITKFFKSDDRVAIILRKRFTDKPLTEIASELERCLSLPKKADRIFAIKDFLLYNFQTGEMNRFTNGEYDGISLVGLAEELLEKLVDILGQENC